MRRTLTLCRAGLLPMAAAVVLLSACGGSEEGGNEATSAAETSASAEETTQAEAPEADSEFCTDATALNDQLDSAFGGAGADPASVEESLRAASEGIRAIEPPSEISGDWNALADGLDELGAAYTELDETDPESVTAFQQRIGELQGELTGASTNVEAYLNEECGIDTGSEETAAPSS